MRAGLPTVRPYSWRPRHRSSGVSEAWPPVASAPRTVRLTEPRTATYHRPHSGSSSPYGGHSLELVDWGNDSEQGNEHDCRRRLARLSAPRETVSRHRGPVALDAMRIPMFNCP